VTIVWGAVLAAGLLLTISPWVWPARPDRAPSRAQGATTRLLEEAGLAHVAPGFILGASAASATVAAAVAWLIVPVPVVAGVAAIAGFTRSDRLAASSPRAARAQSPRALARRVRSPDRVGASRDVAA
jgi:hypothetical protein